MEPSDRPRLTKYYGADNMGFACSITKARIHAHALSIDTYYC